MSLATKRNADAGASAISENIGQSKQRDVTAATPATQRCRVVIYGGRRPALWGHYDLPEQAASVVAALRRHGVDARVEGACAPAEAA